MNISDCLGVLGFILAVLNILFNINWRRAEIQFWQSDYSEIQRGKNCIYVRNKGHNVAENLEVCFGGRIHAVSSLHVSSIDEIHINIQEGFYKFDISWDENWIGKIPKKRRHVEDSRWVRGYPYL